MTDNQIVQYDQAAAPTEYFFRELMYSLPRHAPQEYERMTTAQKDEFLKRNKDDTKIAKLDAKIKETQLKVKELLNERNSEVERINRKRRMRDDEVDIQTERKIAANDIKKRKHAESLEKEQAIETIAKRRNIENV